MIGVVGLASGRASRRRTKTPSSPITIVAEVQPKASEDRGRPGMMTAALSASLPSMRSRVSGVICGSFQMRVW